MPINETDAQAQKIKKYIFCSCAMSVLDYRQFAETWFCSLWQACFASLLPKSALTSSVANALQLSVSVHLLTSAKSTTAKRIASRGWRVKPRFHPKFRLTRASKQWEKRFSTLCSGLLIKKEAVQNFTFKQPLFFLFFIKHLYNYLNTQSYWFFHHTSI